METKHDKSFIDVKTTDDDGNVLYFISMSSAAKHHGCSASAIYQNCEKITHKLRCGVIAEYIKGPIDKSLYTIIPRVQRAKFTPEEKRLAQNSYVRKYATRKRIERKELKAALATVPIEIAE